MRSAFVFPTVATAIREATSRAPERFRVVHFSVQIDHLHLIVEAADEIALSSGMRGLAIRIARRVNRLVRRNGRVWADRWHGRELTSPSTVRSALRYVLCNFRKHNPHARATVDRFSSAPYFRGFRELKGRAPAELRPGFAHWTWTAQLDSFDCNPRTWLLRVGWERKGGLSLFEIPSAWRR
jgi:REP element-mobilizing transposase RayT